MYRNMWNIAEIFKKIVVFATFCTFFLPIWDLLQKAELYKTF